MTDYPTITADEARVGDTLRLTFIDGSTLQGKARRAPTALMVVGLEDYDMNVNGRDVSRIQRVQAAPSTMPTEVEKVITRAVELDEIVRSYLDPHTDDRERLVHSIYEADLQDLLDALADYIDEPQTPAAASGSKIAYPDGEMWTLAAVSTFWHHDGTTSYRHPDRMPPGWVEVTTVPTNALNRLRKRNVEKLANLGSYDHVDAFLNAVDGEPDE